MAMEWSPVGRARGVSKWFGQVIALDEVDFDVAAGQVHGLVGPNGAGKTTLLGLLLGLALPDAGTLEILGESVRRTVAIPEGVAGFVDGPSLYPTLSARQNLAALASLRGIRRTSAVDDALEQVGLSDVAESRVRGFSLGMRQRLGLAAALLTRPRMLVLDEPANGLDPAGKRHVHGVISQLSDDGVAVVLSSHRMDDLAALCSDVTLLAAGRVVFTGPLAKLAAENDELDYRLLASEPTKAAAVASGTPGLRVLETGDTLVVRGPVLALDHLVIRLVEAGVAVRELTPVISPLEAAFLALTGTEASDQHTNQDVPQ